MEQYAKQSPMSERQIEWMQEQLFRESGPFYHISTKPLQNGIIFQEEEEQRIAMNWIGIIAKEVHVDILAFALMSNHFHFISIYFEKKKNVILTKKLLILFFRLFRSRSFAGKHYHPHSVLHSSKIYVWIGQFTQH